MNHEQIAQVCHETNRALCATQGDHSQASWEDAPDWQRESAIKGVQHATDPSVGPEDSHRCWMAGKIADGWDYGKLKDPEKKTHPCLLAYHLLPLGQRIKDTLFLAVARALLPC